MTIAVFMNCGDHDCISFYLQKNVTAERLSKELEEFKDKYDSSKQEQVCLCKRVPIYYVKANKGPDCWIHLMNPLSNLVFLIGETTETV